MFRIGVLCSSEIAFRRFMPALNQIKEAKYIGVAVNSFYERFGESEVPQSIHKDIIKHSLEKAQKFTDVYGGKIFDSYESMILSDEIDSIYIPLPPGLHYYWAKKALESGKNVLLEKPSTISSADTLDLVATAEKNGLTLHENYMFIYHDQISKIDDMISSGCIGDIRLYSIRFGFPLREKNDFRYSKSLGGGALNDAGGYTIKYAYHLLGKNSFISDAHLSYIDGFEVDMFGSGTISNNKNLTAQISFGMDNDYKCELEIWGNHGKIYANRILTAPPDLSPTITISRNNTPETVILPKDDTFKKSILEFLDCMNNPKKRTDNHKAIIKQAELVEEFRKRSEIR